MNKPAERMQCMEIWGGNRAIEQRFEAVGLNIHVHSNPYRGSDVGGGDIYYLTSCASGRISRFLLADVSGHGEAAADLAISLRDLLRDNVNRINQQRFVEEMNLRFGDLSDASGFATAVVATYFEPQNQLSISVAGHPYPIYYRAAKRKWVPLDPAELQESDMGNLPLGVHEGSIYPGRSITTEPGDMFLLYSDAFIEAVNPNDNMIGFRGLVRLLNQLEDPAAEQVIPFVRSQLQSFSSSNLDDDDATIILGDFTSTRVRLRDNLLAPFRLLGKPLDNTRIEQHRAPLKEDRTIQR